MAIHNVFDEEELKGLIVYPDALVKEADYLDKVWEL